MASSVLRSRPWVALDEPRRRLTPAQVATIVGCTPDTIRRWTAAGSLPSVRLGRRILIDFADVERLMTPNPPPHDTDRHEGGGA